MIIVLNVCVCVSLSRIMEQVLVVIRLWLHVMRTYRINVWIDKDRWMIRLQLTCWFFPLPIKVVSRVKMFHYLCSLLQGSKCVWYIWKKKKKTFLSAFPFLFYKKKSWCSDTLVLLKMMLMAQHNLILVVQISENRWTSIKYAGL